LGLGRGGSGFGDFSGRKPALGFFGVCAGIAPRTLAILCRRRVIKIWPGLNRMPSRYQNFVDAAADLGADPDIAGFDSAGTLQSSVAMEPTGVEPRGSQRGGGN